MQKRHTKRIVITGMGVVSPLGNDVATFWAAIKAGKSGAGPVTRFDASRLEARIACEVKGFDPSPYMEGKEARKMALFSQYAVAAAVQAWADAGLPDLSRASGDEAGGPGEGASGRDAAEAACPLSFYRSDRVATVLGNGIGGIEVCSESHRKLFESGPGRMLPMTVPLMIANEAAGNVAMRLGVHGPALTAVTACASGTDALGQALDLLRAGRCDAALAGGTEAAIGEFAMGAFCRLKALSTSHNDDPERASRPFDKDRDGFVLGEGAAVLVLETEEGARARGARVYAELAGYGSSCDAYHLTAPDPSGEGGAAAIRAALEDSGLSADEIDYYNAHGTSTRINDPVETLMVKKAFGAHAGRLRISSTKSMTGHCIAAGGAMEALICAKAVEEGFVPPTINLEAPDLADGCDLDYTPNRGVHAPLRAAASASLGFGGHNAVVVVRRAEP
jgi:3-oxoacyl-[acyl-carrier-protein] synthase II